MCTLMDALNEDVIVRQLTESMKKSDMGDTTPADIVSQQMKERYKYKKKAMQAFMSIREQSAKNFPQGMSLDEINKEIRRVRYGEEDIE